MTTNAITLQCRYCSNVWGSSNNNMQPACPSCGKYSSDAFVLSDENAGTHLEDHRLRGGYRPEGDSSGVWNLILFGLAAYAIYWLYNNLSDDAMFYTACAFIAASGYLIWKAGWFVRICFGLLIAFATYGILTL